MDLKRLGPYDILSLLGSGGMGEVYRAKDTKLGRDVALKILPDTFTNDPERLARFRREAQMLAALNHPHIGAIYGLDEASGQQFLVLELVDGESLDRRIARGGSIPVDEALAIAKQIAEALEAAHERGIIHRDLKPANIALNSDGNVKVLDFGLAKAIEAPVPATSELANSPTLTSPAMMTGVGMILGTAAYMSPEQAKGRAADKRSDVWAFGCVLYEMLTAKRAFDGGDVADTIAAVIRGEPDWSKLSPDVPEQIRLLLRRCLEKDRKARISDVAVARFLLTETMPAPAAGVPARPFAAPARPLWKRVLPVAAAAVVAGAIVGGAAWTLKPPPPAPPTLVSRFSIPLGEGQNFTANNGQSVAVSPDGSKLVYVANNQLYLRLLSEPQARPIPGTLGTTTPSFPTFSPDSQSVAFFTGTGDQSIKKIAVSGGAGVTICPATQTAGMSWDAGGILFGQSSRGILRVSENGGQPTVIAGVKNGEVAYGPQLLPGGDWMLFTIATAATSDGWDKAQIVVQSLKTAERKTLITGGSDGRYLPTGHIVYALSGVLFAVSFDPRALTVTGRPVPILEGGVKRSNSGSLATTHLSISGTGSLVFVPGPASTSSGRFDLALFGRDGTVQKLKLPPSQYEYPRLSPNGRQIAVGTDDGKDASVWIYDMSGATSIRRLTLGGRSRVPVWSPDGEHVAFQSDREGDLAIFWQRADGTAPAERLTKPDKDTADVPESWSPDGKTLLFSVVRGSTYTVAALSFPDKKLSTLAGIESAQPPSMAFSPDGRWVAYSMEAPGAAARSLNVQPFPLTGVPYQIARSGIHATWTPDGKELLYGPAAAQEVAVSVTTRPSFTFGKPVPVLSSFLERGPAYERSNDITLDGQRLLGVVAADLAGATGIPAAPQIQVVLNWFTELQQRVPTR